MKPSALIPVFHVTDVDAAVRYYTAMLGFTQSFRYGTYVGLTLGACELHISDKGEPRHIVGAGTAYVFCDEVDAYFAQIKAAGARLRGKPQNEPYGHRNFAALDLDDNLLWFGCEVKR